MTAYPEKTAPVQHHKRRFSQSSSALTVLGRVRMLNQLDQVVDGHAGGFHHFFQLGQLFLLFFFEESRLFFPVAL